MNNCASVRSGVNRLSGAARLLSLSGRQPVEGLEPRLVMDAILERGPDLPVTASGQTAPVMVLDLNGDSVVDLVYSDGTIYSGEVGGAFVSRGLMGGWNADVFLGEYPGFINLEGMGRAVPIDVDDDGDTDFITSRHWVYLNDGAFQFHLSGTALSVGDQTRMATIDLGGDGLRDLVMIRRSTAWAMLSRGDGTFAWSIIATDVAREPYAAAPVVADFNGDGLDDVLLLDRVMLREGGGWRSSAVAVGVGGRRAIDADGDGDLDVVTPQPINVMEQSKRLSTVQWNNGTGVFSPPVTYDAGPFGEDFSGMRGDFNGDGVRDVVSILSYTAQSYPWPTIRQFRVQAGENERTLRPGMDIGESFNPYYPRGPFVVDINNDGCDDFVNNGHVYLGQDIESAPRMDFQRGTVFVPSENSFLVRPWHVVPGVRERYALYGLRSGVNYTLRVQEDTNGNDVLDAGDLTISYTTNRVGSFFTGEAAWTDSGQYGQRMWFARVMYADGQTQEFTGTVDLWVRAFFPEGYQGATSREFLPLVNDTDDWVKFDVMRRFPDGTASSLFSTNYGGLPSIAPHSRGAPNSPQQASNIVLSPISFPVGSGPYSVELHSSRPLGATLVRYDTSFDVTQGMGESLTTTKSANWVFPDVSTSGSDFILLYNPEPWGAANVRMTFYTTSGQVAATVDQSIARLARGGLLVRDVAGLQPGQIYSAVVSGIGNTLPYVASLSRYAADPGQSFMALGQPLQTGNGGYARRSGIIAGVGSGTTAISSVILFNPIAQTQSVSIYRTPVGGGESLIQTISLAPFARRAVTLSPTGLGERYASLRVLGSLSEIGVSATTRVNGRNDALATGAVSYASTKWAFAEGFAHRPDAQNSSEELFLYNPTGAAASITLRFLLPSGATTSTTLSLSARSSTRIRLDQLPVLANRPDLNWFSTIVESTQAIVAQFTHWDLAAPGGFTMVGQAIGPRVSV